MKSVNPRIAALFYASVMKVLKVRPVVRRKKKSFIVRSTRYYDDFFIISKTNLSLRGSLPKSGPLDFATKDTFPLFFVGEEALVGVY